MTESSRTRHFICLLSVRDEKYAVTLAESSVRKRCQLYLGKSHVLFLNSGNGTGCSSETQGAEGTGISHIRNRLFLADVGLPQKSGDSKLLNGIAKFVLNFRIVIWSSMVYHRISTSLRYFLGLC